MKRLALATAMLAIGAAGCGSNNTPTTPTNAPTIFTVQLSPANEVPPITNADSTGKGTVVITVNTVKDSTGAVTSGTIDFNVTLSGFPAGSTAIMSHIHNGPVGVPAGVFVDTGLSPGTAVAMPSGSATYSFNAIAPGVDKINQILANPAGFYFNVHTGLNPGGAIRGQLK